MLLRLAVISGLLLLVYWGLCLAVQRSMIYPRPPIPAGSVLDHFPRIEAVRLPPHDVEAWYLPPRQAGEPSPAVIFTHGNGELIDYWPGELETVTDWGVGVLLVEYPGYGRSGGKPSQRTITRTMEAAYDHLLGRGDVDPAAVIAYGRSLGGGAACALAERRPVAGLVLESTFTSIRTFASRFGLFGPLVLDPFDNVSAVERFDGPVLVIHGDRDRIVPPWHGERLAEVAGSAELLRLSCGHNDCPRPWGALRSFLQANGWVAQQPSDGSRSTNQ